MLGTVDLGIWKLKLQLKFNKKNHQEAVQCSVKVFCWRSPEVYEEIIKHKYVTVRIGREETEWRNGVSQLSSSFLRSEVVVYPHIFRWLLSSCRALRKTG